MYTSLKNFFVQGVDKSIFWVYDALVKAKASLSIQLLDAFAFFIFLVDPKNPFHRIAVFRLSFFFLTHFFGFASTVKKECKSYEYCFGLFWLLGF